MRKIWILLALLVLVVIPDPTEAVLGNGTLKQYFSLDIVDLDLPTIIDSSEQLNGTRYNGSTDLEGIINEGFNMDGAGGGIDYIVAGNPYEYESNDVAWSLWFNTTDATVRQTLIHTSSPAGGQGLFCHISIAGNSTIQCDIDIGTAEQITHSTPVTNNEWHHFVLNRRSGEWTIYLDNVPSENLTKVGDNTAGSPWYYGVHANVVNFILVGGLDEIAVFGTALTATNISDLYNSGAGFNPFNPPTPPAGNPTLDFVDPTPGNNTNTSNNWIAWNLSFINTTKFVNNTLFFYNTSGLINTSTSTTEGNFSRNFTQLRDGTYYLIGEAFQNDSNNDTAGNITINIDTTPPANVSGLGTFNITLSFITWNWTNPADSDFNDTIYFVDGVLQGSLGATALFTIHDSCAQSHTLTLHTRDTFGNINDKDANITTSTLNCPGLANGIEMYYRCEENGGPYADSTGSGFTGIGIGTIGQRTGIQAFGLEFDGTAEYVNSTFNMSKLSEWSIQSWLNFDSHNTRVDNIWEARDAGNGVSLQYNGTGYKIQVGNGAGGLCLDEVITVANASTNNWQHLVLTFNGSIGKLYLNNTLVNTTISCPVNSTYGDFFTVNRQLLAAGNSQEVDGIIDEIGIWNRVLGTSEISELWNNGAGVSYLTINGTPIITNTSFYNLGYPNGTSGSLSYSNTTKLVSFTYSDTQNFISEAFINVSFLNNSFWNLSYGSNSSTAAAGTITFNLSTLVNTSKVVVNSFFIDTNRTYIRGSTIWVDQLIPIENTGVIDFRIFKTDQAEEGLFWTAVITGTLMTMGFWNPPVAIGLGMFGLYISSKLGFLGLSQLGLWAILAMGLFVAWRLKS